MATNTTKNFLFQAETDGVLYSVKLDIQAGTGNVHVGHSTESGALKTALVFAANQDKHDSWWAHAAIFGAGRDTSLNAEIAAA